jgi:hypothetical protein
LHIWSLEKFHDGFAKNKTFSLFLMLAVIPNKKKIIFANAVFVNSDIWYSFLLPEFVVPFSLRFSQIF